MKKVFVLGIDGAPPELILNKWLEELPNIKKMIDNGISAKIRSTIPPSTCVAWTAFASGRDAGELGVYSYTYRVNNSYDKVKLINSNCVKKKSIWDILSLHNKKSIILNLPLTYPIKPLNGIMVSGFLTPDMNGPCIYPENLKEEIKGLLKEDYMFDIAEFAGYKNVPKEELLKLIYKMTDQHFKLIKYLIRKKEWDFFMAVIIGSDRIMHTFWSYCDETHKKYKPDSKFKNAIKEYFQYLDKEIGEIRLMLDEDTTFIISSDHGMRKMEGRINLNDFLIKEGYLVLRDKPQQLTKFKMNDVNWSKTKAYAIGSYQGRVYFNVKGKDPKGIVKPGKEYEKLREEIIEKLRHITSDNGNKLDNRFYTPETIYPKGYTIEAPDIIVYFDNLLWGVNNDVGNNSLYSWSTTVGSDDAGHAPEGVFILEDKSVKKKKDLGIINILDVMPTILKLMNIPKPKDLQGKPIL